MRKLGSIKENRTSVLMSSITGFLLAHYYTSFPVASLQQVGNINDKSVTSWQHFSVYGEVTYGETCVMDFGHYWFD